MSFGLAGGLAANNERDPLELDRLLEPVHHHEIVIVQPHGIIDLAFNRKFRKKNRMG